MVVAKLTDLPTLRACLEQATWRQLLAIVVLHELPGNTRWKKADLIDVVYRHLSNRHVLVTILEQLPAPVQHALTALARAGGKLPTIAFARRFGVVRPPADFKWAKRSAHDDMPLNPAEHLFYLGLIHFNPSKPRAGVLQQIALPQELLSPIADRFVDGEDDTPLTLVARPGFPAGVDWHMTLLLASLANESVVPLRGGWIPPGLLITLANRMGLDRASDFECSRSERRLPYLAFLHYLGLAAELFSVRRRFELSLAAWAWLEAPEAHRIQALWASWRDAPRSAAEPFRFPWRTLSVQGRQLLLDALRRLPTDTYRLLHQVVEQIELTDPYAMTSGGDGAPADILTRTVAGPLHWFGIVDLVQTHTTKPLTSVGPNESWDEEPAITRPGADLHVRLTPLGAWLLAQPGWGPPIFPQPRLATSQSKTPDLVLISPRVQPDKFVRLASYVDWPARPLEQPPSVHQTVQLSKQRVAQAIAEGVTLRQLMHTVADAIEKPLSRRQKQRIRRWAEAGKQVRIRPMTVLETSTPALMGRLRSRQLLRRHLGAALSPTISEVDPQAIATVSRTLRNLELFPAYRDAGEELSSDPEPSTDGAIGLNAAEASLLLLAAKVLIGLGEHLALTADLRHVAGVLETALSTRQRSAADFAASGLLDRFNAALEGYLALPAWQSHGVVGETIAAVENALAGGQDLVLTYWATSNERPTVRRVTPYYLERRYGILYLKAYCHLRHEERTFRMDRVEDAILVEDHGNAPER